MRSASEIIRRSCLGCLLGCLFIGTSIPVAASVRRSPTRHRHATIAGRRIHSHLKAHRLRSHRANRVSYLRVSTRIPNQRIESAQPAFPSPAFSAQDEQRIPRQAARKTAALQGIIHDSEERGVVGALIALTNRATGATRTISADADGVFRLVDIAPGSYLLLVQSDGFENITRDDLRLVAGDVVTIELTLASSKAIAARASRLPRMMELGPPAPAIEVSTAVAFYRDLRRRPDAEPGYELAAPELLPPSQ
jgi:hypothetical protein